MIASLTGTLRYKSPSFLIIDVQGVGYEVSVPLSCYTLLPDPDSMVTLFIHTHLTGEALQLYGFLTREERELFRLLLSVSGIGPKLALTLLSGMSARELVDAVGAEDLERLCAIPGIGKKTAARVTLELKEKIALVAFSDGERQGADRVMGDLVSALVNLGYAPHSARETARIVCRRDGDRPLEDLIRESLKLLSK